MAEISGRPSQCKSERLRRKTDWGGSLDWRLTVERVVLCCFEHRREWTRWWRRTTVHMGLRYIKFESVIVWPGIRWISRESAKWDYVKITMKELMPVTALRNKICITESWLQKNVWLFFYWVYPSFLISLLETVKACDCAIYYSKIQLGCSGEFAYESLPFSRIDTKTKYINVHVNLLSKFSSVSVI